MKNSYDFVCECGCDIEFASQKAEELDNFINAEAEQLANAKAEEKFNAQKDYYRHQIIKEINESNVIKKGAEISRSSPYIRENIVADGKRLSSSDFINDKYIHSILYEDIQLIYNDIYGKYGLQW